MFYIVGTPLGNVDDISLRAVETLISADVILSEDTRSFPRFYERIQDLYKIYSSKEQEILSFHDQNEFERMPSILEKLKKGLDVALISQAGMPLISDPGGAIVNQLTVAGIPYTVIPGPTAFVNAVVLSGFSTKQLFFLGFLPKKKSEIIRLFEYLLINRSKRISPTIVFYESPYRIKSTLELISKIIPEANVAVCREMTKKFEEVVRGKAVDLMEKDFKGELTIVMQPVV